MTPKRVPTVQDLQGLTRDEWESLGHDLCATMYDAERVEDRLGRGNGLDALRQLEPAGKIDGWQFRRFDDRLGDHQIEKLQEAVTRAVAACKNNLGRQLKTFTVFGNIDLQPGHLKAKGEDARFTEFQEWCKAQYNVKAVYRGVTWVRSRLLKHPHLRPDLFEDLAAAIELAKTEILQAVGGDADIRKAFEELKARSAGQLAVLVTEAKRHFERGQKRGQDEDWLLAVESLKDAERLATAPGVERTLLAHIQAVLAGLLSMTGRLNEALDTGRRATTSASLESDASLLRLAQGNLAIVLADLQQYEEARSLFLEVLRMYEDAAELSEVVRTLTNLLHIDTSIRNWSGATTWAARLEEKRTRLDQMIGVTEVSLNAFGNIASFRFKAALELPEPLQTEELRQVQVLFQKLADASRLAEIRRTTIIAEATLASVLQHLGQYDDADDTFKRVIQTADDEGLAKLAADFRYNQAVMLDEAGGLGQAAIAAADAIIRYYTIGDQASMNDAELLLTNIRNRLSSP
jgi:tetratricopeptide (TPR) repeat protein